MHTLAQNLHLPLARCFGNHCLQQLCTAIMRLFHELTGAIREVSDKDRTLAIAINSSLAEFVLDLLPVADRGFCFKLVETYLDRLRRSTDVHTSLREFLVGG